MTVFCPSPLILGQNVERFYEGMKTQRVFAPAGTSMKTQRVFAPGRGLDKIK
ncbi:MAG: hypothetical protein LBK61_05955 [Spirochaetaceae bacterium]|jgi:hypothetical protein|nr:hypothetical protein [Spirochaetaceae bacterium]